MAKLVMELPKEVMDEFKWVYENTERIFGGMTKAGAETALGIMLATCPNDVLKSHGKITKTYRTPSDGGINTKAGFWGYIPFHHPPSAKNRQYLRGVQEVVSIPQHWEYLPTFSLNCMSMADPVILTLKNLLLGKRLKAIG